MRGPPQKKLFPGGGAGRAKLAAQALSQKKRKKQKISEGGAPSSAPVRGASRVARRRAPPACARRGHLHRSRRRTTHR